MKKAQIAMLGATLLGLAVLIFFELKDRSVPEHQPGTIQIQEHQEESGDRIISFHEIQSALEAEQFPCSNLSVASKSDYEIRLCGTIETETIRSYLSDIEVGYNALLGLLPDSCACVIDLGLAADSGTLCVWCTGAELEGIHLPEAMIPQAVLEKLSNSIWPVDGMQQLNSILVTDQGIVLYAQ